MYRVTKWTGDLRPGGQWRSDGVGADGVPFSVEGEFLEVVPPRKLVQTWKAAWDGGNVTTITFHLEPIEGGTRLTLWHKGFSGRPESCQGHTQGWERVLGWLARHVTPSAPAASYFLCRLIPPRATFPQDMTADEADMMKRHAAYWTGLLQRGTAVVFGPVGDPKGVWGVGIVRAGNDEEVNALRDGDPVITSKSGFRYEILPMMRAVVRE